MSEQVPYPHYETRQAMQKFNEVFGFETDPYDQDWYLTYANEKRIWEFIEYYPKVQNNDEKMTLMMLIMASFEEFYEHHDNDEIKKVWRQIERYLLTDFIFFKELLDYWALWGENIEDCFPITPIVREFINRHTINNLSNQAI